MNKKIMLSAAILSVSLLCAAAIKIKGDPGTITAQAQTNTEENVQEEKDLQEQINELKAQLEEMDDLKDEVTTLKKQVNILHDLKISGFFDVSISNYKNKPNIFSVGNFELDIEHNYKNFQVAAALVFYEGAELRVGFIDYHLFGSRISPRGRLFQDEGIHLQIGRFDVPFGNDWRYFTATDRISVTPPLTTEIVMGEGLNDEGARILLNFTAINATAYMIKGVEEQYSYGGNSFGGRIGITPFNNPFALKNKTIPLFELGFSYIYDMDRTGATAEKLFAGDVESKIGPVIITSEYIYRDKEAGIVLYGYHFTGGIDVKYFFNFPLIVFTRYETLISKEIVSINFRERTDKNSLTRFSAGININISNISFLKFEYQNYLKAYQEYKDDQYYSKSLYYVQLVIKF